MSSFIIYDPSTGVILGGYTVNHVPDFAAIVAANTPSGASALPVEDGHPVLIDQSGWQVQNGALAQVTQSDAKLLADAKAVQLASLTASYAAAKSANVSYMGTEWMGDTESQQTFANALTVYGALGATPADFFGVDANYAQVPLTLEQLKGLTAAYASQFWAVFQRWIAVKQALAVATTVAEVQATIW